MLKILPVIAAALCVPLAVSAADVTVAFVDPQNYADSAYSRAYGTEKDRAQVRSDIEQHLRKLAERGLPSGDLLKIEVLDIDLAGRFEPFSRAGSDVRIIREITWPRIKLRYTLLHDAQVVASAEEQVADLNYLLSRNRYGDGDRLRYEKAMLDDWFEKRFSKR